MRPKIVGSGITKKEIIEHSFATKRGLADFERHLNRFRWFKDFDAHLLKEIEELAWSCLEYRGSDKLTRKQIRQEAVKKIRDSDYDSLKGYALRFLDHIQTVREVHECCPGGALYEAFRLGSTMEEAAMKFDWEQFALLGKTDHEARRRGGRAATMKRRDKKAALHAEIRKEAARFRGGYLPREATSILARKYELSSSQIRRILKQQPA